MNRQNFSRKLLVCAKLALGIFLFACSDIGVQRDPPVDAGASIDGGLEPGPDLSPTVAPAEGRFLFAQRYGGNGNEEASGVATDSTGNIFVGGWFWGPINFGGSDINTNGGYDSFIVKLTSAGGVKWARTFGNIGEDRIFNLTSDKSGNVIAIGWFQDTVDFGTGPLTAANNGTALFVVKYAADGSPLWARSYSDTRPIGGEIAGFAVNVDANDNILVGGHMTGMVNFGGGVLTSAGSWDVLLLKLSPSGDHIFSKRFGGPNSDDDAFAVTADPQGNIIVAGRVYDTVDFGGGPLLGGTSDQAFLASFKPDGSYRWAKRLGPSGTSYSVGQGVAIDKSGDIIFCGRYMGPLDCGGPQLPSPANRALFVAKFHSDGTHVFSRSYGGGGNVSPEGGLALDSVGRILIGGSFGDSLDLGGAILNAAGSIDGFVVKLAADGSYLWSHRYGNSQNDSVQRVAIAPDDSSLAAGVFYRTVDFGGGPLTSNSNSPDAFLVNLSP